MSSSSHHEEDLEGDAVLVPRVPLDAIQPVPTVSFDCRGMEDSSFDYPDIATSPSQDGGGRLWKLAGEQVGVTDEVPKADNNNPQNRHQHKNNKWTETILAKTQSRATPNAETNTAETTAMLPNLCHSDNTSNKNYQHRPHSTPLLITGIVGILAGWLGNAVVGASCFFASVDVPVGMYAEEFSLRFGLYKYSTVDSSLNGYKYCYPYSGQHEGDAPFASRTMNILALLSGTICLGTVWWYLVTGHGHNLAWNWAIRTSTLAAIFQLATLAFFAEPLCQQHDCAPGPASYLALLTAAVWLVVGYELRLHRPDFCYYTKDGRVVEVVPSYQPPELS